MYQIDASFGRYYDKTLCLIGAPTLMQRAFVRTFALPRLFLLCLAALVLAWGHLDHSAVVTPRDTFPVANSVHQSEEGEQEAPLPPGV